MLRFWADVSYSMMHVGSWIRITLNVIAGHNFSSVEEYISVLTVNMWIFKVKAHTKIKRRYSFSIYINSIDDKCENETQNEHFLINLLPFQFDRIELNFSDEVLVICTLILKRKYFWFREFNDCGLLLYLYVSKI